MFFSGEAYIVFSENGCNCTYVWNGQCIDRCFHQKFTAKFNPSQYAPFFVFIYHYAQAINILIINNCNICYRIFSLFQRNEFIVFILIENRFWFSKIWKTKDSFDSYDYFMKNVNIYLSNAMKLWITKL